MGIEQLDELGKIRKRAGQPVDLVNQHNINLARPDIGQELLQSRPVERGAGECTIVVAAGDQPPAVVRLTLYICLTGLALGVERVEGELKIVLRRLARIDGTARELADGVRSWDRETMTHEGRLIAGTGDWSRTFEAGLGHRRPVMATLTHTPAPRHRALRPAIHAPTRARPSENFYEPAGNQHFRGDD